MPTFSIIIPVYNNGATIEKALLSAIEQDGVELEIIVMDGGSNDNTVDVIKRYDTQIAIWKSEKDHGVHDALQKALNQCSGDIISILCADDWLEAGILHDIAAVFDRDPTLDAVTTEAVVWKQEEEGALVKTKHFKGKSQELSPLGSPIPNARFYKKSVYDRYGFFHATNHRGQPMLAADLEMLLRLSQHDLNHHCLSRIGYNYLAHPGSLTFGGNQDNERQMYDERAHIAEEYLQTSLKNRYAARLKRWHRRGTVRLYFWHKQAGRMAEALAEKQRGLAISPIRWRIDHMRMCLKIAISNNA